MKKLVFLFAMIFAVSMAMGQNNVTTIDQVGDDHQATVNQGGELNRAYVEQNYVNGNYNGAATVIQQGDENLVKLRQNQNHANSVANITQVGSANRVVGHEGGTFFQNSGGIGNPNRNLIDVMMEGDGNVLYATAGEAQKNINTFLLDIDGDENRVGMEHHFGWADIDIEGDLNRVTLSQWVGTGDNWERADVDIFGDSNVVGVDQTNGGNNATVYIDGSLNNASVLQTGGDVFP